MPVTSDSTDTLDDIKRDSIAYATIYGILFLLVAYRVIRDKVHTLVAYHAFMLLALIRVGAFVAQYELANHWSDDGPHAVRAASTARDVLKAFGTFFLVEGVTELVPLLTPAPSRFAVLRSYSVTGLSQTRFVVYHLRHFILAGTLGIGVAGAVQRNDAIFTGNADDWQQGKALLLAAGGIWLGVAVLTLVGAIAIAALPAEEHAPSKAGPAAILSLFSALTILAAVGAVWAPIGAKVWANTSAGTGVFIILPDLAVLFGAFLWRVDEFLHITSVFGVRRDTETGGEPTHHASADDDKGEAERSAEKRAVELHDEIKAERGHEVTADDSESSAPSAPADDYIHVRKRFGLKAVLHRKSDQTVDAVDDAAATAAHFNGNMIASFLPKH
ncbi:uncharacterized protein LOC62_05G007593 [Vanrija pseudolonga]|uniref:Uncharacterized protein n=1 Tax=Vanrija pseudolonga TaxID=143232 RepID=A0AAF0YCA4_9TREE|nr:hypothetical protein LOC62_05G007593 [Vanrija pseudolonga]